MIRFCTTALLALTLAAGGALRAQEGDAKPDRRTAGIRHLIELLDQDSLTAAQRAEMRRQLEQLQDELQELRSKQAADARSRDEHARTLHEHMKQLAQEAQDQTGEVQKVAEAIRRAIAERAYAESGERDGETGQGDAQAALEAAKAALKAVQEKTLRAAREHQESGDHEAAGERMREVARALRAAGADNPAYHRALAEYYLNLAKNAEPQGGWQRYVDSLTKNRAVGLKTLAEHLQQSGNQDALRALREHVEHLEGRDDKGHEDRSGQYERLFEQVPERRRVLAPEHDGAAGRDDLRAMMQSLRDEMAEIRALVDDIKARAKAKAAGSGRAR